MEAAKNDVQKQVDATNKRISAEQEVIAGIEQSGSKVSTRSFYISMQAFS